MLLEKKTWLLKVFVADIIPLNWDLEDIEDRMLELENLVNTFGWLVILKKIQKRVNPDYRTYIGSWKLEEIVQQMKEEKADVLIIWNILKPYQLYNVNEALRPIWATAWDRIDLILKIFERHAKSVEAKLQIELAAIRHMWPRIFGMWMELSRQWWWYKARWSWETNTERMKRHLKERERKIRDQLEEYKKTRQVHREARLRNNLDTVWIVWYTNAGKSSLMNALTLKWVLSENKLFATLWTSVGKMYIDPESLKKAKDEETSDFSYKPWKEILINDTIGFIRDLPPDLIDAFSSTLEDSVESKILLHVVDSSDPKIEEKIKVVDDILHDIHANQRKIYVFNKIDLIDKKYQKELKQRFGFLKPVFISADKREGINELKLRILEKVL